MKKGTWKRTSKPALLIVGAGIVVGSFMIASGQIVDSSNSLLAAVFSVFSNKPAIIISKSANSPSGVITTGDARTLAVFSIGSTRTSYWDTLQSLTANVMINGPSARSLLISNVQLSYRYCIPAGVTYGYGYKGGSCTSGVAIPVNSISKIPAGYSITFYPGVAVYPQQTSGVLTLSARVGYSSGGSATGEMDRIRVVVSGTGVGDQCRAYSSTYGYSQCVPLQALVSSVSANFLNIQRSYGYGYCLL